MKMKMMITMMMVMMMMVDKPGEDDIDDESG